MLGTKTKDQEEPRTASAGPRTTGASSISVISKEMRITGDCVVEGQIRIEGQIIGNVRAGGLELARSGSVKGDLAAMNGAGSEPFAIAGKVDGRVHASRVDVGPSGTILGGVEADEAQVRGRVEGGIVARKRLVLEETAVVEGDVRATTLALKEGGQVNGTIVMGERATTSTSSKAAASSADGRPTHQGSEVKGSAEKGSAEKGSAEKGSAEKGSAQKGEGAAA